MFDRHVYKEPKDKILPTGEDYAAMLKYDGANYFVPIDSEGNLRFISRRPSVKGGFPDRTASLPHLTDKKMPEFAGSVLNVELIHTGHAKNSVESHAQLSGILNSLPHNAITAQNTLGPVRAVLHNVINPDLPTFKDKYEYMQKFEQAFGKPEVMFTPKLHFGKDIKTLSEHSKREGREGIIVTHYTKPEKDNPRLKEKHVLLYNLRIIGFQQEVDINGNLKDSMGAALVADASGREVAAVGSGWSRQQRIEMWKNPKKYIGTLIQVKTMGLAARRLRMPIYNGDADGEIDLVTE